MIRDAKLKDFDKLLPIARIAHRRSPFGETKMNVPHMRRIFAHCITFDDGFAKVVIVKGKMVGGMVGVVGLNQWGAMAASDVFMFSKGGTDRLLREFKKWAKERKADYVHITDLSGNERYHQLIQAVGLKKCGTNFTEGI